MLTAIINLPEQFVSSTTATMSQLFTDLSPIVYLILGVILAIVLITTLINAITPK